MAKKLIHCPDCGREVSRSAPACPGCGAPIKAERKPISAGQGCLVILLLGLAASMLLPLMRGDPSASDKSAVTAEDNHLRDEQATAQVLCKMLIERSAQFDFEWTDGWTKPAFPRSSRSDGGILTLQGDAIRMQNGFGAWQNQIYTCRYDTAERKVVELDINAGRL